MKTKESLCDVIAVKSQVSPSATVEALSLQDEPSAQMTQKRFELNIRRIKLPPLPSR